MDIKSCPVCGGKPEIVCGLGFGEQSREPCCYVECGCGASIGWYMTTKEAVEAWNGWAN